jgi:hypothetical protein
MAEHPKPGGWGALIAAKLVCCGGLLLFATGYLTVSGIGSWLYGGGAMGLGRRFSPSSCWFSGGVERPATRHRMNGPARSILIRRKDQSERT